MPSGIYALYSACNGRQYIGSSSDIQRRWRDHRVNLRSNKHPNAHLQNAWNKYGEDAFEFIVLEECEIERLIEREQWYMDQCDNKYNCAPVAGSLLGYRHSDETRAKMGSTRRGRKFTDEHRANISASKIGHSATDEAKSKMREAKIGNTYRRGHSPSPETRAKMSASAKRRRASPETRARMSEAQRAAWERRRKAKRVIDRER